MFPVYFRCILNSAEVFELHFLIVHFLTAKMLAQFGHFKFELTLLQLFAFLQLSCTSPVFLLPGYLKMPLIQQQNSVVAKCLVLLFRWFPLCDSHYI